MSDRLRGLLGGVGRCLRVGGIAVLAFRSTPSSLADGAVSCDGLERGERAFRSTVAAEGSLAGKRFLLSLPPKEAMGCAVLALAEPIGRDVTTHSRLVESAESVVLALRERAVPGLLDMISSGASVSSSTRVVASAFLGLLGPQAADASGALRDLSRAASPAERCAALWAYWRVSGDEENTRRGLHALLTAPSLSCRLRAAVSLATMAGDSTPHIGVIRAALESPSPLDRLLALRAAFNGPPCPWGGGTGYIPSAQTVSFDAALWPSEAPPPSGLEMTGVEQDALAYALLRRSSSMSLVRWILKRLRQVAVPRPSLIHAVRLHATSGVEEIRTDASALLSVLRERFEHTERLATEFRGLLIRSFEGAVSNAEMDPVRKPGNASALLLCSEDSDVRVRRMAARELAFSAAASIDVKWELMRLAHGTDRSTASNAALALEQAQLSVLDVPSEMVTLSETRHIAETIIRGSASQSIQGTLLELMDGAASARRDARWACAFGLRLLGTGGAEARSRDGLWRLAQDACVDVRAEALVSITLLFDEDVGRAIGAFEDALRVARDRSETWTIVVSIGQAGSRARPLRSALEEVQKSADEELRAIIGHTIERITK